MAANFARECSALVRQSNAAALAGRLALASSDSPKRQFLDFLAARPYQAGFQECERCMQADWAELVCHSGKAAQCKRDGDLSTAFSHQEAAVEAFLRLFKQMDRSWIPILKVLLVDLRKLGAQADDNLRAQGKMEEANKLEGAGRMMRKSLAQEMRDEENDKEACRTHAALFVANQCNKVFFALNTLKHVKSLVLPPQVAVEEFPAPDRVTWHFFQGRMALMEGRMEQAEQDLAFSFNNTPSRHIHNRHVILGYLVPVRLILHQSRPSPTRKAAIPTPALLRKYKLTELVSLVEAFRTGNIAMFDEAMAEHQDFFIRKSIYLLLHKLKLCVYRNLFKRAHAATKKSQMKLSIFVAAVRACGAEADPEQVEGMLANLIHQGLVKGYIAHKQQVVVLKKDDPFRTNS
mmetsp:Transcript_8543/g.20175  ORF Transcript_8543/g.20175 Transcript_8543/m.20175 type:complete len:405 (+) Transcript_8543:142-1356(+)